MNRTLDDLMQAGDGTVVITRQTTSERGHVPPEVDMMATQVGQYRCRRVDVERGVVRTHWYRQGEGGINL